MWKFAVINLRIFNFFRYLFWESKSSFSHSEYLKKLKLLNLNFRKKIDSRSVRIQSFKFHLNNYVILNFLYYIFYSKWKETHNAIIIWLFCFISKADIHSFATLHSIENKWKLSGWMNMNFHLNFLTFLPLITSSIVLFHFIVQCHVNMISSDW